MATKQDEAQVIMKEMLKLHMQGLVNWEKSTKKTNCIKTAEKFGATLNATTYSLNKELTTKVQDDIFCIVQNIREYKACTTIDFSNQPIGDYGAFEVASLVSPLLGKEIPLDNILSINLSGCEITHIGGFAIVEMLRRLSTSSGLKSINLENNQIGDDAAMEILKLNKKKGIEINIQNNKLTDPAKTVMINNGIKAFKLKF